MRQHEHACFVARTGLEPTQIVPLSVLERTPALGEVVGYDALLMGGSGAYLVSKANQPRFEPFLDLLRDVVGRRHPIFAACYGFQSMVHAMGGSVIHDPDHTEVGTFEITLTEAGACDPIFSALPARFLAQQGHKDRAERLPEGLVNLASSDNCALQAFRLDDAPVWAVQFHPELDRDGNRMRYRHYLESYSPGLSEEELQRELESFVHSPEASRLLPRFLDVVFDR